MWIGKFNNLRNRTLVHCVFAPFRYVLRWTWIDNSRTHLHLYDSESSGMILLSVHVYLYLFNLLLYNQEAYANFVYQSCVKNWFI